MGRTDEADQFDELIRQVREIASKIDSLNGDDRLWAWPSGGYDGVYRARRLRDEVFDEPGLFGEPAWDILLGLAGSEIRGRLSSVTSTCLASGVPPTTALRYIDHLEKVGLVIKRPDPQDGRRSFVALSPLGRRKMNIYVQRVEAAQRKI